MNDVFEWKMSAIDQRVRISALRQRLLDAHRDQKPVAMGLILDLLQFATDQGPDVAARGSISISGDTFANIASDPLLVSLTDPVLKDYSVNLPAAVGGSIRAEVATATLTLTFEPPDPSGTALVLDVPRLSEMGLARSEYQRIDSISLSPSSVVTRLTDVNDPNKKTWIEVALSPTATFDSLQRDAKGVDYVASLAFSLCGGESGGGGGGGQETWYVVKLKQCSVNCCTTAKAPIDFYHQSDFDPTPLYTGTSEAECSKWITDNPDACPSE